MTNVPAMPVSMCRVTVHCGGVSTDLTLPTTLPVAELIPSIVDILGHTEQGHYRLSGLGCAAFPGPTTLAQNGIRDGAVLLLSCRETRPPLRRCEDDAQTVAATLDTATTSRRVGRIIGALAAGVFAATGATVLARTAIIVQSDASAVFPAGAAISFLVAAAFAHRVVTEPMAGLTLSIVAVIFAGVAGLLAVPGTPGAPNVLLAAMATAVTAVLAIRVTPCAPIVLTTIACCAIIAALAALAGVLSGAPPLVVGSIIVPVCLGLIEVAPRVSILVAGLSPVHARDDTEVAERALRAAGRLTSLRAAFATAAAGGAAVAALSSHRGMALAAVTGVALLLHSRTDHRRAMMFVMIGIASITTTFAIAGITLVGHSQWIAALSATLAAAAIYLSFVGPAVPLSPVTRRGVDALGCVALAAVVPLTCWTCGAFTAIRGLNLP